MTITGLKASPITCLAGEEVSLIPQGVKVGHVLRYYLKTAPTSSALLTIDTLTGNQELAETQLKSDKQGRGVFTPDVPGSYVLQVRDVTETVNIPSYDGEEFASGDSDNAETTAPITSLTYWVAEMRSRRIGAIPDYATLTVRTYNENVDEWVEEPVTLEPNPQSEIAKIARYSEDVETVRLLMESPPLMSDFQTRVSAITNAITVWNSHIQKAASFDTHGASDAASQTAVANATDLSSAITLLNDIKSKYEAHRVKTSSSIHSAADTANAISSPNASTLATAIDLLEELWTDINSHGAATGSNRHVSAPFDGQAGEFLIPPRTAGLLVTRTNELKSFYNAHVAKTTNSAPHAAADTNNIVQVSGTLAVFTPEGFISLINAWADSIFRHGNNKDENGADVVTAYHNVGSVDIVDSSSKPPFTSGRIQDAFVLAEILMTMAERHMLNTELHTNGGSGSYRIPISSWNYTARLTRSWVRASEQGNDNIPDGFNPTATDWAARYGWDLLDTATTFSKIIVAYFLQRFENPATLSEGYGLVLTSVWISKICVLGIDVIVNSWKYNALLPLRVCAQL